jgi:hypothetical protein
MRKNEQCIAIHFQIFIDTQHTYDEHDIVSIHFTK